MIRDSRLPVNLTMRMGECLRAVHLEGADGMGVIAEVSKQLKQTFLQKPADADAGGAAAEEDADAEEDAAAGEADGEEADGEEARVGHVGGLMAELEKLMNEKLMNREISNCTAELALTCSATAELILTCQGCSTPLFGGGFCRGCKANDSCRCKGCGLPIRKTTTVHSNTGNKTTKRGARCGSCNAVVYCSRACQKADWSQHKLVCQLACN